MTKYELLLDNAKSEDVTIIENYTFESNRIKGLYCDNSIAISDNIVTEEERTCILAEELGHHYTSIGNIIDTADTNNLKQEHQARIWAYNKMVGLRGIIDCYKANCNNRYEMAKHLEVTEDFLNEAICYLKDKYGIYTIVDRYIINFEPCIYVLERFE